MLFWGFYAFSIRMGRRRAAEQSAAYAGGRQPVNAHAAPKTISMFSGMTSDVLI